MRLVTFVPQPASRRTPAGSTRIGALAGEEKIVDLNAAGALYGRDVEKRDDYRRLADSRIPADMRRFIEGGDASLEAAAVALDYALRAGEDAVGTEGETVLYRRQHVQLKAPIRPGKFFHTAGNFREHHQEAVKAGFSHPVLPWIVFFQNVDAIIGPDEPVIYPSHLTRELDYELELAIVLKKAGKHFREDCRLPGLQ